MNKQEKQDAKNKFIDWWNETGSAITPKKDHDSEQHAKRVAESLYNEFINNKFFPKQRVSKLLNFDSKKIIGRVYERFNELEHKNWDWRSFYNGWLEGRSDISQEKVPKQ